MAVRDFVDSAGVAWRVWETQPTTGLSALPGFESGWLTFESSTVLRRLAPVPIRWEELSDRELELLCCVAPHARRRSEWVGDQPPAAPA